jgi:ankyrin repeat protein
MRNGDTVLHVAAAYNSLESMIILTNFGGMELFVQKNRYGLRAIEIAQKMRNYECFEVLQKLERNVTY